MAEPLINIKEKEVEEKIKTVTTREDSLVEQLRGGLEQAKGFLLEELIKIGTASPSKTIDVNNNDVKQAVQSLIYADPDDPKNKETGRGVLSITAAVKDNEKKIIEWIEKGYKPEAFERIRKEMQELPDKLQQELSIQKGLDNLINQRVKNNAVLQQIPLFIDDNNNIRGVNAIEKNNIINKINQDIEISSNTISTLLQDRTLLKPLIEQITKTANKFFGEEGVEVDNACVWDEEKLTPKNILQFTEATNHNIKAFEVIQQGLKKLTSGVDTTLNQKITETLLPVMSNLMPEKLEQSGTQIINIAPILKEQDRVAEIMKSVLTKLDTGYIIEYSDTIINELQEINNKGTSFWEKIKSTFITGKDYLRERLEQSVNTYAALSDEYVKKEINDKIFSNALTNEQIAAGLTKFMNKNIGVEEVLNLVEIRKADPVAFDKALFKDSKQPQPKLAESVSVNNPQNWQKKVQKKENRGRG